MSTHEESHRGPSEIPPARANEPAAPAHLLLLLHAHLPFVRHPEHPEFFEESWLFEAVLECYLPLLQVLDGWERDGIPGGLTLSVSPTLLSMWRDPLLGQRLGQHLERLICFAEQEATRAHFLPQRQRIAHFYCHRLRTLRTQLKDIGGDWAAAFGRHAREGRLELITCAATHPTLPLLLDEPGALRIQLRTAIDAHARSFGEAPTGFWLPECAWDPELEPFLLEAGIRWTVLETHGVLNATPRPQRAIFAPVRTAGGLAVFGRDPRSARQVWSRQGGYPGDPRYREFHRDVGHEADWEYVRPHLHGASERTFTGLKFHRVTGPGPGETKALYDRDEALAAVQEHAAHFVAARVQVAGAAAHHLRTPAVLMAPYDAELFGHWWFEGPEFLDAVARRIAASQVGLTLTTPSQSLKHTPELQTVQPAASTWGEGGHFGVWLDPANAWTQVPLRRAGHRLTTLASRLAPQAQDPLTERLMAQASRELLLAQSSDWPFLMKMGTAGSYPATRFREHLAAVNRLLDAINGGNLATGEALLADLEQRHNLFPEIRWRDWA
jgi:1,4-alpha-glucan branching enzyme